ncbi:VanZ family protein [Streptomyces yunnanensis]|uniref:VanZ like family protein n=1 Tax=Streptomyces yunnanensis TaxID=156453 RepID=A0A9X8QSS4_9ACTN|nr:VanZ family protein [Streptomyces yunnanensis]SHL83412.1 VanZ like family protein [Streptomyces yunnanensis]
MFSAIFKDQLSFLITAPLAVLVVAAVCFWLTHHVGRRPWAHAALGASVAAELALTLFLPSGAAAADGTHSCVINRNVVEPFATEQGLLNLLLFLPIGFFGLMALRSLLPILAGSILLSLATELLQTLLPWVHRGCDSSDLEMNSLGGIAGALLAWALLRLRRRPVAPLNRHARATALTSAVLLGSAGIAWALWITPTAVDATSLQLTGDKEQQAAHKAIRQAFGDRYTISNVQLQPGVDDAPDNLLIALDSGSAELSWPDASQLNVSLESSSETTSASFSVAGVTRAPADEKDALSIAHRYAGEHYPSELRDAEPQVYPVGDRAELGWIVSWRRRNSSGVLMPMRLDVQINTAGRVSQLLVRSAEDPRNLPPVKVDKASAQRAALASMELPKGAHNVRATESELLAVQRDGEWRAQWMTAFEADDKNVMLEPVYVDANSGKVDPRASRKQKIDTPDSDEGGEVETTVN